MSSTAGRKSGRTRPKRASYREGVRFIALNDDPLSHSTDEVCNYLSARLMACLFEVPPEQIAGDVVRYRKKELLAEEKYAAANERARREEEGE